MTLQHKSDGSIRVSGWFPQFLIALVAIVATPIITTYVGLRVQSVASDAKIEATSKKSDVLESKLTEAVKLSDDKFNSGIANLTKVIETEASHTREITTFQFAAIGHRIDAFEARIEKLEAVGSPLYNVQPRKGPQHP